MKSAFLELGMQWFHKTSFVDLKGIAQLHKTKEMGERLLDLFHHATILYSIDVAVILLLNTIFRYIPLSTLDTVCNLM